MTCFGFCWLVCLFVTLFSLLLEIKYFGGGFVKRSCVLGSYLLLNICFPFNISITPINY